MKPNSIRAKGKRGENVVCERIIRAGLGEARREAGSGNGRRKGDIFSSIPFLIEHKNQKTIKFGDWVSQAKEQARKGHFEPNKWCLTIQDPNTPQNNPEIYAVIEFDEFLELIKGGACPKVKDPDKKLKWLLETLRTTLQYLIRNQGDKYYYGRLKKVANEIIKIIN
jgi:hypothetical protein